MTKQIEEYSNNNKKAVVIETDPGRYAIDFYLDNKYTHSMLFTSKSLYYVKDAAENYTLDIFHPYRSNHESRKDYIQQSD
jgi:hypothetical protein